MIIMSFNPSAWRQKSLTGYCFKLSIQIDPFAYELTNCASSTCPVMFSTLLEHLCRMLHYSSATHPTHKICTRSWIEDGILMLQKLRLNNGILDVGFLASIIQDKRQFCREINILQKALREAKIDVSIHPCRDTNVPFVCS